MALFPQNPFSGPTPDLGPPNPPHPSPAQIFGALAAELHFSQADITNEDYRRMTRPNYKPLPASPVGRLKSPPRVMVNPPRKTGS